MEVATPRRFTRRQQSGGDGSLPPSFSLEPGAESGGSMFGSSESRSRFEAYRRLQASAVAFGEKLPIPEIVAIGGQSDGKSSLLEAFLGFRFNVKEVEMGTRRPLILQMVHDPTALEPTCRLQDEDSDEYGPPILPASSVAEAIRTRTEEHLKKVRGAVSSKPIVLRAEYAFCPNLTIIDTPGFVLKAKKGEPETTPDEILSMVKSLAAPQHRLLVFLQQSSVEWCSSLWLDSIRAIDPTLRRTIVVISKFDNRLKEFAERWEVDRYLSASGYLGENVRPFFVALPKDRVMTSNEEFRKQIASVDADILTHLRENIKGGFDEERFGEHIGFRNLKQFLESELQRRYREAAPATLALLEQRCSEVADELGRANAKLAATSDVAALRRSAMIHASTLARHIVALIDGAADPDPAEWGRTTQEERGDSRVGKWPGLTSDVKPPNAMLKLYGGAAFERVLDEFRCAACSVECPPVSKEKVANILLAHAGRGGGAAAAASGIARAAARSWLGPLLDTACDRLAYLLRCLFDLAVERLHLQEAGLNDSTVSKYSTSGMGSYVGFHASLRRAHDKFIEGLARRCKELVGHHLEAITSPFSLIYTMDETPLIWDTTTTTTTNVSGKQRSMCLDMGIDEGGFGYREEDAENVIPTGALRESQLTVPETPSPDQQGSTGKRTEYGLASGRLPLSDASLKNNRGLSSARGRGGGGKPKEAHLLLHSSNSNSNNNSNSYSNRSSWAYAEVCSLAAEYFGKMREVLVERSVPSTLKAGFLTPCRDELVTAIGVELFGVRDEQFMEMFTAPGAVEFLENERNSLQKRCNTLNSCLHEFRTLARSL